VTGVFVVGLPLLVGTCRLDQLVNPPVAPPVVIAVPRDTVAVADSILLTAAVTVGDESRGGLPLQWTSSNPAIATVDSLGRVRGVGRGRVQITARLSSAALNTPPVRGSAEIWVVANTITIAPSADTLTSVNDTLVFAVTARDAKGQLISFDSALVQLVSDPDSTLLDLNTPAQPRVRARKSGVAATVRIRVDTATQLATVLVRQRVVTLTVTPDSVRLNSVTAQRQLTATGTDARGNPALAPAVTWISRAPALVQVNAAGLASAMQNGSTWVVGTADDGADSARVVVDQVAARVDVTPNLDTLRAVNARRTIHAVVRDSLNQPIPGATPGFASLDTTRVKVVGGGGDSAIVEAQAEGQSTITATGSAGGATRFGSSQIAVSYTLASLTVAPTQPTLDFIGDTVRLAATGRDQFNNLIPNPTGVRWSSSDTSRVKVDSVTGLATARAAGDATVRGEKGSVFDTTTVRVLPPILGANETPFIDTVLRGSTDTVAVLRDVTNSGTQPLDAGARLARNSSWLTVVPDTFTLGASATTPIQLRAVAGGLLEGTYLDTVVVRSTGADGSPRRIPVRVTVVCPIFTIGLDTVVNGAFGTSDCRSPERSGSFADFYRFNAAAGDSVRITLGAPGQSFLDTYLYLLDDAGTILAQNNDCPGGNRNSCLGPVELSASGFYRIEATTFTAGATFGYALSLARPTAPNLPTSLEQRTQGGITIPPADTTNSGTVEFRALATDVNRADTLRLEVEVQPVGTPFTNVADTTGSALPNTGTGVTLTAVVTGLTDGDYHWQVRVVDQTSRASAWAAFGAGTADFTVLVSDPILTVSPTVIVDSALAGSTTVVNHSVQVSNTGVGGMSWTRLPPDSAWLTVSPPNGSAPATLTVSLNPTGLGEGTRQGIFIVDAGTALGSPDTVAVTFVIQRPVLEVSPGAFGHAVNVGTNTTFTDTIRIANAGSGPLSWTAAHRPAATWLTLDRTSGGALDDIIISASTNGLSAGIHADTIVVTASGAVGSPDTVFVTLTVHQPLLAVSPLSITDSANVGSTAPRNATLIVSNAGSGTLTWTAAKDSAWLTLSTSSGTAPDTLTVTLSPTGLGAGVHRDTIVFSSPEPGAGADTVVVTFTLHQPVLTVSPTFVSDTARQGSGVIRDTTLIIGNAGQGTLSWIATPDSSWITLLDSSGTGPDTVVLSLNSAGLATGIYQGRVVVSAAGAAGSPDTVNVQFEILPPPILSVTPLAVADTAFVGSAAAQSSSLAIANTGAATLTWSAAKDSTWLALSPSSGGAPDTIDLTLSPAGLSTGTHRDTVVITAPGANGSPTFVEVRFEILPCMVRAVTPDTLVTGSIADTDCGAPHRAGRFAQVFAPSLGAGETLSVRLEAPFNGYLIATNGVGSVISETDTCSGSTACLVDLVVPANGIRIEATSFDPAVTGAFSLLVTHPQAPAAVSPDQLRQDTQAPIGVGGATDQNQVTLRVTLTDPNARDSVRAEFEVRPVGQAFINSATDTSALVTPGSLASATKSGLVEDVEYHWQVRAVDNTGRGGPWVAFGGNAESAADFRFAIPENPDSLVAPLQFRPEGTTLTVGATDTADAVVIRATPTDPDPTDLVRVQVELRRVDQPLVGTPTDSTTLGAIGIERSLTIGGLADDTAYHWQARTKDSTGRVSGWTTFGGNANGVADFRVAVPQNPNAGMAGAQFKSNGSTSIGTGATTDEATVVFRATLSDPDPGDSVRLAVEVRRLTEPFTGTATVTGALVASGAVATASVGGLADDTAYHWQYWAVDKVGRVGPPTSFGANAETAADFRVAVPQDPNLPAALGQFQANGSTVIPVGGNSGGLTVVLKGTLSDPDPGSSLTLELEVRVVGTAFSNTATQTSGAVGSGQVSVNFTAVVALNYHWQARTCDATLRCSAWVSFPQPTPNPEGNADFVGTLFVAQPSSAFPGAGTRP
jgi:BACON domain-containing protein/pre-peptidase/Big-like domain-containing protein